MQLRMSMETARRVENLLDSSQSQGVFVNGSCETSSQRGKQSSSNVNIIDPISMLIDSNKEKLNLEVKKKQEKIKVINPNAIIQLSCLSG